MFQFGQVARSRLATFGKVIGGATVTGFGGFQIWTRKCYFEPFGPENDALFKSQHFKQLNPGNHSSINDSCVREVPLSQIPPELVQDALNGGPKLLEKFSAGLWGGYGYAIQRNLLARSGKNESNKETMLWDKKQLLESTYEKGTIVTDHFVVLEKTPNAIVLWGAEDPSKDPSIRREMENLSQLTAKINVDKGVAEFRMKNIFYNGAEKMTKDLFPPPIVWLHLQYCKLLVEAGANHCMI